MFYTTRTNQNFQIFERIISRGNIIEINFKLILKNSIKVILSVPFAIDCDWFRVCYHWMASYAANMGKTFI